jgi:DNA replication protein DnaC
VPLGHPHFGVLFPCVCKLREQEERARTRAAAILTDLASSLGRLSDCTLESFKLSRYYDPNIGRTEQQQRQDLEQALDIARAFVAHPGGALFFYGHPETGGAGKSHLAVAILQALAEQDVTTAYATVPDTLDFLKDAFDRDDVKFLDRMNALKDVEALLLDDFGSEKASDWTRETLFKIVNHRYLYNRITLFTSNLEPQQLDFRIASRLSGWVREVPMRVSDYRRYQRPRKGGAP